LLWTLGICVAVGAVWVYFSPLVH
jgi:transposase